MTVISSVAFSFSSKDDINARSAWVERSAHGVVEYALGKVSIFTLRVLLLFIDEIQRRLRRHSYLNGKSLASIKQDIATHPGLSATCKTFLISSVGIFLKTFSWLSYVTGKVLKFHACAHRTPSLVVLEFDWSSKSCQKDVKHFSETALCYLFIPRERNSQKMSRCQLIRSQF